MSKDYSREIAGAIDNFLVEDDWNFSFNEENGIFRLGVGLKGKIKNLSYIVSVGDDGYNVYATSPIGADGADSSMMAAIAEFVCRANYGLRNGNFELDFNDGPTKAIIEDSMHCPALMFQRYASGIIDVIFSGTSAKDAIEKCEKPNLSILQELISSHPEMAELAEKLGLDGTSASNGEEAGEPETGEVAEEVNMELFGTSASQ